MKLKMCPFCGNEPRIFNDRRKTVQCINEKGCPKAYDRPIPLKQWNTRPIEDELLEACEKALEHLDYADISYANGNIAPNGIDEGDILGGNAHCAVTKQLRTAIAKARSERN